jgi:hypothetical protein
LIAFVAALHFLIIFLILCASARRRRFSGSAASSFKCSDIARPMTQSPQTFSKISSVGTRPDGIRLFGLHQLAGNIERRFYARNLPLSIHGILAIRCSIARYRPLQMRH